VPRSLLEQEDALSNSRAFTEPNIDPGMVMNSTDRASPLTELSSSRESTRASLRLASAEEPKTRGPPVWIKGIGWSSDTRC